MKKLLMKWFPGYFKVCKHVSVDFEDLPKNDALSLIEVDDETNNTFDKLGISDDRGEFLMKEIRKAMIDTDCRINVMRNMEKHIKHINEFYIVVLIMEREAYQNAGGGLGGLLQAMMQKGPPPPGEGE
jgi:hypothetical protein